MIYTRHHKTARATAALLLPIIISAASVDNRPWLPAARQALGEVGLKLCGWVKGPLFRPLGLDGVSLCKRGRGQRFHQACSRNRARCGRGWAQVQFAQSEASKAGLSRFTRACLGRHVLATESSEALYSVDLGLPAVQELEELLAHIREGVFLPGAVAFP